MYGPQV